MNRLSGHVPSKVGIIWPMSGFAISSNTPARSASEGPSLALRAGKRLEPSLALRACRSEGDPHARIQAGHEARDAVLESRGDGAVVEVDGAGRGHRVEVGGQIESESELDGLIGIPRHIEVAFQAGHHAKQLAVARGGNREVPTLVFGAGL